MSALPVVPSPPARDGLADVRVVHVITSLTTGGAERQLELLVGRSSATSLTVALYEGGPVADSMVAAGHRVRVLGMDGWRKLVAPLRLALLLRRLRPDVVHVHLLSAQLWGIPAARLARVPVVVSSEHSLMDDTIEGRPHTWWLRRLYRLLERATTTTVAVSATTADRLRRWGVPAERIVVSDNGIDFDALAFDDVARHRVRAELGLGRTDRVIAVVGRLDPVKRVDVVLRALAPMLRDGLVLVVAGTGSRAAELRRLADDLGIDRHVRWLGARGDMAAVLSAADVLVSTSADETFGMAVVEAVGNGLPVAYVEAPALDELTDLPDSVEHLPAPQGARADEESVRDAVRRLLTRPRRPGAPAALVERYGADGAAQRLDDLYATLLRRRG
ncbi:glycosyltransferase [Lapillicoccus jejuensis]|uniref:D-inositol 3-phosphate glycosyltransferase n=1 Tax=Lapillicoccus jejuensis TaxID=402171 RepID=A0A542E009_9MICO|nr:glycosyltransferase [Lapillicoccus jejuensis]TQJ08690.1 glycosyltransferase involved in cell wall biosynthesis [Lapillicoccus jejuensis]